MRIVGVAVTTSGYVLRPVPPSSNLKHRIQTLFGKDDRDRTPSQHQELARLSSLEAEIVREYVKFGATTIALAHEVKMSKEAVQDILEALCVEAETRRKNAKEKRQTSLQSDRAEDILDALDDWIYPSIMGKILTVDAAKRLRDLAPNAKGVAEEGVDLVLDENGNLVAGIQCLNKIITFGEGLVLIALEVSAPPMPKPSKRR